MQLRQCPCLLSAEADALCSGFLLQGMHWALQYDTSLRKCMEPGPEPRKRWWSLLQMSLWTQWMQLPPPLGPTVSVQCPAQSHLEWQWGGRMWGDKRAQGPPMSCCPTAGNCPVTVAFQGQALGCALVLPLTCFTWQLWHFLLCPGLMATLHLCFPKSCPWSLTKMPFLWPECFKRSLYAK